MIAYFHRLAALKGRRNREKGFTLIEMMAVVTMISILGAPQFVNFQLERDGSNTGKSLAYLGEISTKVQGYVDNHNGACPTAGNIIPATFGATAAEQANYMPSQINEPLTGTPYVLNAAATGPNGRCVWSIDSPAAYNPETLLNTPDINGGLANATDTTVHYNPADGGTYKS